MTEFRHREPSTTVDYRSRMGNATPTCDPSILQAGDTLLYRPSPFRWRAPFGWLFGRLIARKTWHNISHVEIYDGASQSVASRDGQGVQRYPLRLSELAYVLRPPSGAVDLAAARAWFATVQGQGYDWKGLTRFVKTANQAPNDKQFCSEFWLRYYRAGRFNPFSTRVDADTIAPGEILDAPTLDIVWTDGQDGDLAAAA